MVNKMYITILTKKSKLMIMYVSQTTKTSFRNDINQVAQ